jgi:hypothetical protein
MLASREGAPPKKGRFYDAPLVCYHHGIQKRRGLDGALLHPIVASGPFAAVRA